MSRSRIIVIGLAVLIVVTGLTFPLWRPLFLNDVVNEAFPALSADEQAAFRQLSQEQQDALMNMENEEMVSALLSPDVVMTEEPMTDRPTVINGGSFVQIDVIHGAEGTATLYQLENGSRVVRFEDFRVTNGPDLHVLLSTHEAPRSHDDLGSNYIDLGQLKGNVGNQNYAIPGDVDLSLYKSVVIYCVPFQIVFSSASLH
jgi:hypothetical protein